MAAKDVLIAPLAAWRNESSGISVNLAIHVAAIGEGA
jgi:hypothetical protein